MSPEAIDSIECLQTMDELDSVSNIVELSSAIEHLSNGKAPEPDNKQPDLIKTCKSTMLTTIA